MLCIILIQAVSTTLGKKLTYPTPDFRKHSLKLDGDVEHNPSLRKKVTTTILKDIPPFSFYNNYT